MDGPHLQDVSGCFFPWPKLFQLEQFPTCSFHTEDSRMIFQLSKMHQAIPEVRVPQSFSGSDSGKSLHISELSAKFCCSPQRWSFYPKGQLSAYD